MKTLFLPRSAALALLPLLASAAELHVAPTGDDTNLGTAQGPLKTIQRAANLAQPGDTITVHAGTYRERITPPRGGTSDKARITYQAAPGERAVIKGSEIARGWKQFMPGVWKLTLPNTYFGRYNPYKDLIKGDWFVDKGRAHHTGEVYLNGKSLWETHLFERLLHPMPVADSYDPESSTWVWLCESDEQNTYIYANFHDKDPNAELVEINVRDSCFYPDQPGRDYITVRGFELRHAATQWAAPTAEQIGLIGTHWSKGWIIENNVISDSKCSGVTLGKERKTGHNVWINDPCKDGAIHYVEVIDRALAIGWSRETIGSHQVRNNVIYDCEQTGICGSLGAVFSEISSNHIHHIWAKRQFTGAEMGGIKLHAAIDVLIQNNHIHHAGRGLWMDWMAQGTRISGNLCYENSTDDLFMEVDHGPFVVDNNVFLSPLNLRDWSEGGAYVHNLFAGKISAKPELKRSTPYHLAHSTIVVGLSDIKGGDDRFLNNLFIAPATISASDRTYDARSQHAMGFGLWVYDTREFPISASGNVYFGAAQPSQRESNALTLAAATVTPRVLTTRDTITIQLNLPSDVNLPLAPIVTGQELGTTRVSQLLFESTDGKSLRLDTDYGRNVRQPDRSVAGPFGTLKPGANQWHVR